MSDKKNKDELKDFEWVLKYLSSGLIAGLGFVLMFCGAFTMIDAQKKEQALLNKKPVKKYDTYNIIDNGDTLYLTQQQWNLYREQRRQKIK